RAAYRRLAKQYHPDKHFGDKHYEELFKELQLAYSVLSNPGKRKKYDLKLRYGVTRKPAPQPQQQQRPQRREQPRPKRAKPAPEKRAAPPDSRESRYIALSFLA